MSPSNSGVFGRCFFSEGASIFLEISKRDEHPPRVWGHLERLRGEIRREPLEGASTVLHPFVTGPGAYDVRRVRPGARAALGTIERGAEEHVEGARVVGERALQEPVV